jgi:hypothetical protein
VGIVGDLRKHMENFENIHFRPKKLFFLKISGTNPEQTYAPKHVYPEQTEAPKRIYPDQISFCSG